MEDYTQGPVLSSLLKLSIPVVLANIMQTAYNLIDTFWVGKLGPGAVAAVSLSFPVMFLIISIGMGMTIAGSIFVAQFKGKKDQERVDEYASQTYIMMTIVSVILSIIGYFLSGPMMRLMGAEPAVLADAVLYLQISFIGMIAIFGFFVFQALMRGVGEVKIPLYIVTVTVILNFFLDPLFIYGWGPIPASGIGGVAWATVATQTVATLAGLFVMLSGRYGIDIAWAKPDLGKIQELFKVGLPASLEQSSIALGLMAMAFVVATFETTIIAAYGIGMRIFSLVIVPAIGLAMGTSALVGQNLGAGKIDRAEKVSTISQATGFVSLTLLGVALFLFAAPISAVFIDDAQVIEHSAQFIRIMSLTFGFIGLQQTINGTFQGAGRTFVSMILSILSLWIFRVPVAYVLSQYIGEAGIWWSFPIANVLSAIVAYVWFRRGSWKHRLVQKPAAKVWEETVVEEGIGQ